ELDASTKLFTELTTFAASLVAVAICAADGLDGSAVTEVSSASTEDVMAPVSLGKSLLAESTSVVASLWICLSCDVGAARRDEHWIAPADVHTAELDRLGGTPEGRQLK